jgi:hypothetical protein
MTGVIGADIDIRYFGAALTAQFPNTNGGQVFVVERENQNFKIAYSQSSIYQRLVDPNCFIGCSYELIPAAEDPFAGPVKTYTIFLRNLGWPEQQVLVWQNNYVQVRFMFHSVWRIN